MPPAPALCVRPPPALRCAAPACPRLLLPPPTPSCFTFAADSSSLLCCSWRARTRRRRCSRASCTRCPPCSSSSRCSPTLTARCWPVGWSTIDHAAAIPRMQLYAARALYLQLRRCCAAQTCPSMAPTATPRPLRPCHPRRPTAAPWAAPWTSQSTLSTFQTLDSLRRA